MELTFIACDDNKIFMEKLVNEVEKIIHARQEHCKIVRCFDGTELVSYCMKEAVDVILVDIDMPKLDGFSAVAEIQKYKPDIAVIFITSHTEKAYQSFDYQPFWFISKTDLSKLEAVMIRLIKKLKQKKRRNLFSLCMWKKDRLISMWKIRFFLKT